LKEFKIIFTLKVLTGNELAPLKCHLNLLNHLFVCIVCQKSLQLSLYLTIRVRVLCCLLRARLLLKAKRHRVLSLFRVASLLKR